jgi:hypothetical protein
MRTFKILGLTFVLAVCGTSSVVRAETPAASPATFLLASAAAEFNKSATSAPERFREVQVGHYKTESGEKQYVLCGEFLQRGESGKGKWTSFATVQTSSYEQVIGDQSESYCRHRGMKWEGMPDLSSSLKLRLEALRGSEAK